MYMNVYGNPDDPKVILLAPMMVSGENLYELMRPYFRGDYYFIAPVLATGADAYLLSPILFDMTGFPPIDIFYGTREVMIAYLNDMKAACTKCGVPLHVHIGRGMMHCWGAMEFVPEAQTVRQEYFEALR